MKIMFICTGNICRSAMAEGMMKKLAKDNNLDFEIAKKQIEERKYEEDLQEKGYTNITKMVFAFKGKEVKMQII